MREGCSFCAALKHSSAYRNPNNAMPSLCQVSLPSPCPGPLSQPRAPFAPPLHAPNQIPNALGPVNGLARCFLTAAAPAFPPFFFFLSVPTGSASPVPSSLEPSGAVSPGMRTHDSRKILRGDSGVGT
mmetsp:Transcript_21942/g.50213  ORF Transcript_21942/g.50213 Transcript_21942/m.50213 type:complete len:128 (+) Transcript_21942:284-667(+)